MDYSSLSTVLTVFQIVICVVALWAFVTWNNGRRHSKKARFAEEVLQAMYRARQVFAWARFPAVGSDEGNSRNAIEDEKDKDKEYRDRLYVPIERLHRESALFSDLYVMRYRFASFFGHNSTGSFQEIESIRQEILSAAKNLLKDHENPRFQNDTESLDFEPGHEFSDAPVLHADNMDFAMVDRGVNAARMQEYTALKREWLRTIFGPDKRKRKGHQFEGPDRRSGDEREPTPRDAEGWFERTKPEEDEIKKRIDTTILAVEKICAPYIRSGISRVM
ncbi:MAG: hypothetical protein GY804_13150 [Alphaproteobacteria bacterium]|nr:hypothetical protein [Alphaproteobacteria bacterium]